MGIFSESLKYLQGPSNFCFLYSEENQKFVTFPGKFNIAEFLTLRWKRFKTEKYEETGFVTPR